MTQPEGTYWHFLSADRYLGYNDGREVIAGETLTVNGPIKLRERGLHASARVIDALTNAAGPVVSLVTLGGEILHGDRISVASERTALWIYDADKLLYEFACIVAEKALAVESELGQRHLWPTLAAIETSRRWIKRRATDEEMRVAYSTACIAANNNARFAAASTAKIPANSAAYEAAYFVVCMATDSEASEASKAELNELLTSMLMREYTQQKAGAGD